MSNEPETSQTLTTRPVATESIPPSQGSKPEPKPTSRGTSTLSKVNTVLVLTSLGLLGYLFYEQYEQSKADKPVREAANKATKADDEMKPGLEKLRSDVNDLTRTVQERPASADLAPQIKVLDEKVAEMARSLAGVTDRLDSFAKQVDSVSKGGTLESSPRFEAIEKRVAEVAGSMDSIKAQVALMTTPVAMPSTEMDQAVSLFKQGKWGEAKEAFSKLQTVTPDDARVWYFSAITNGLAKRDWKGESERLVTEGMARERAGKPDKAKIDAAFSDLTAATGKDWLEFYRKRATQSPLDR
jgi:hypothetical protein